MKSQLLVTFTDEDTFESVVNRILDLYELINGKVFILKLAPSNELIVSYNIVPTFNVNFLSDTIMVHRKRETNTLYTINALNQVIKDSNSGFISKSFRVDWEKFRNSIILSEGSGYKVLSTKLFRIIHDN